MKVPFGPASWVGYILTALGSAATLWAAASTHPTVSAETLLIVTMAAGVLTNLGRQIQAPVAGPVEVLTEKPESAVTPEAPPVA